MHADRLPGSLPALWSIWGNMASVALEHGPTPGHYAIARMGGTVITQNVDGLHQAANSSSVIELHGSALRARCLNRWCTWHGTVRVGEGPAAEDHGVPGRCPLCGELTRPDVVLFDELLPESSQRDAFFQAGRADLLVAVGTSGVVFPAAALPAHARANGARTVLIDPDPPRDHHFLEAFDQVIRQDAHEVLPTWERQARGAPANPFLEPF
jgi:NAD-dependent deacetylase